MIRDFLAAIAFLTRLPVGRKAEFSAPEIGRAMRWFPIAACIIGGLQAGALILLRNFLPPLVTAALVVAIEPFLTGALHLDGLADTADGFGGGRTKDDVLRIMRDHAIGAYGATALVLCVVIKIALIQALLDQGGAPRYLVLAAALGRWAAVLLSAVFPYARSEEGAIKFVGRVELVLATVTALVLAAILGRARGLAACFAIAIAAGLWGLICRRRIGGVTGDTVGAGVECAEVLTLLAGVAHF